ncbi:MAG TPA: hypothetical protein VFZ65_09660 [Planctomycetota bacterium]|nr:hypothetical protein [Planctomycetota bacterium]
MHSMLGRILPLASLALASLATAQTPLTFGNLVVVRIGDGAATLTNASAPVFLDEYTPGGTLVQTIALPTAAAGTNLPFTDSGTATSEGYLNISSNGIYLLLGGYGTAPGLAAVPQTDSMTVPRVIARVDLIGTVDTSTALTDAYSGGAGSSAPMRSVCSDDGQRFWTSGTGASGTNGIRFVANLGATTSLGLNAGAPTNTRTATIYSGQLYTSSASTVYQGVCTVGTGLPTTIGQAITLLNGFPTASGPSTYDHFFADPDTLYVADDTTGGAGGINKWTRSGGVWTLQYGLALPGSGCRGVTGFRQNGVTTLWATANYAFPNLSTELVTVVDTGPGSVVTSIAVAGANQVFRGLRFLDVPTTLQRLPATCGVADIVATGTGQTGTEVITTIGNAQGFAFVGYGLTALGLPFCNCTVMHDFSFLVGGGFGGVQHTLALPSSPANIGTQVLIQGLDFLAPGGCPDPLFTLTDAYSFVVQ